MMQTHTHQTHTPLQSHSICCVCKKIVENPIFTPSGPVHPGVCHNFLLDNSSLNESNSGTSEYQLLM
ncbi:hypothetical protein TH2_021 [Shewanella phage Thanatos-2]|nr:hypothetical protein TH2_021 [Shewanella phage Thanatos-2]